MRSSIETIHRVWIIEMLVDGNWEPTVGTALSEHASRRVVAHWRNVNPDDEFRVRPYARMTK